MRINRIAVTDFRSHRRTVVGFKEGINLIIGQNGSGKSSLLDAIMVALYWPSKPKDLRKDDLMRIGGSGTEVVLFIEKDGVEYQIYRNLSSGMAFVKYRDSSGEWKHVLDSPAQKTVREWAERLLPYEVFMNAVYVRQGEIEAILESDESRERVVRQVLGLDRYENVYRNLLDVRREVEARIKGAEEYLRGTVGVEEEVKEKRGKLTVIKASIRDLESEIPSVEAEVKVKERVLEEMNLRKRRIDEAERRLSELEGDLKALSARASEVSLRVEQSRKRLEELRKRLTEMESLKKDATHYERLRKALDEYRKEKGKVEALLERYRATLKGYEDRLRELMDAEKKLRRREVELKKLRDRLEGLKKQAERYESVENVLKEIANLRSTLRFDEDEIQELEAEVERAKGEREAMLSRIEEIHSRLGELSNVIAERKRAVGELKRSRGKCPVCGARLTAERKSRLIKGYMGEIKKAEEEMEKLKREEERLRHELNKVERRIDMEGKIERAREIIERINELERSVSGVDVDELRKKAEKFAETEKAIIRTEEEVKHLRDEVAGEENLKARIREINLRISDAEKKLEALKNGLSALGYSSEKELEGKLESLKRSYEMYHELASTPEEVRKEESNLKRLENTLLEIKGRIARIEAEVSERRRDLESLKGSYSVGEHERMVKDLMAARERLASMKAELMKLKEEERETERDIKRLMEKKERRNEMEKSLSELRKARQRIQEIREKVKRYKALLREGALARVGEMASEIFEELTEEKYSGVVVRAEEKKVKLGVLYGGREYTLGFLSGGERIALGLAFRLALSLYLAGDMSLLILDEPTPYLDDERRRRLVDIMSRYLRKIPQVIVVSHDEELKDAADHVIRVSLENGTSVVREVNVA